ncbi:MAG: Cytidylate kinase [Chlamydiae bacterium]|nr:Cytidylate kinase [Chlamydiota bacterium]
MIIVIDGPSGSGKSTLAKMLSKQLNIPYFDTGAMYRSFCWFLINREVSLDDQEKIKQLLNEMKFEIQTIGNEQHYIVNGTDISMKIRNEEVTRNVSKVSAYLFVREYLVSIQRKLGESRSGIFEGRDMGTVVFPNADIKFFLFADPNIRAVRRFEQMKANFPLKKFEKDRVLKELLKRDEYDSTREHSPLKQAGDAISIDVSCLDVNQVFEKLKAHIDEKKL